MPEPRNPFHWSLAVTSSEAFVGRESELGSIFGRLGNMGCSSIVGDRRIGKSSLLYQAYAQAPLRLGFEYRPIYVDMQRGANHTLDGLLTGIAKNLGRKLEVTEETAPPKMLAAFERAVEEARREGLFPVLLVDEFESLAGRIEVFGDNVLESWRSLCAGQMAVVTASQQPLSTIMRKGGYTSPFYNIFEQVKLGEFTEAEAREFREWTRRAGTFDGQHVAFILKEGRQHPLRLMVCAYHLFEAKQRGEVDYEALRTQVQNSMGTMLGQQ